MKDIIHFNPKHRVLSVDVERSIRCKCNKYWGMDNHKLHCERCKTEVIARGNNGKKEKNNNNTRSL